MTKTITRTASDKYADSLIPELGRMDMPEDFPYREVLQKGRPRHGRLDPFRIRHPQMDTGRRAKIFAPFDALKGFDEAIQKVQDENR